MIIRRSRNNLTTRATGNFCMINNMDGFFKYRYLPIFRDIPVRQLEQIEPMFEFCEIPAGQVIFYQGAEATHLYILLTGKVSIRYKPYDGPILTVSSIIPGWVFGWSAALERKTYTSTAVAVLPSSVYRLSIENLVKICCRNDDAGIIFLDRITSIIADRLNQTPRQTLAALAGTVDGNTEG